MNKIITNNGLLKYCGIYIALCLFLSIGLKPAYCGTQNDDISAARYAETIIIKGVILSEIIGEQFKQYSLMAVINGGLKPIPFQFDDTNVRGFPYVPGSSVLVDGSAMVLDSNDELVFMYADSAKRLDVKNDSLKDGEISAEIEISDETTKRFVYLIKGNSERSEKDYVDFDEKTFTARSKFWSLKVSHENPLVWDELNVFSYKGEMPMVDSMKTRIGAKLGFISAQLTNDNIIAEIDAIKDGAIRDIVQMKTTITILGIPFAKASASYMFYSQSIETPVFASIPSVAAVLKNPRIEISLDYNIPNMQTQTGLGKGLTGVADGKLSKNEMALAVDDTHSWLAGNGNGYSVVSIFTHSENYKPNLELIYKDGNDQDKPERIPGSFPQVGYRARALPAGEDIFFGIKLIFSENLWINGSANSAVNEILNPPSIRVISRGI